jgi:hypothetical protein
MLLDASLVRIVLVPAAMKLLATGRWLPGGLNRWLPPLQLKPAQPSAEERDRQPSSSSPLRPTTEMMELWHVARPDMSEGA